MLLNLVPDAPPKAGMSALGKATMTLDGIAVASRRQPPQVASSGRQCHSLVLNQFFNCMTSCLIHFGASSRYQKAVVRD